MADPFLGGIRIMSFGYAPRYWAMCNGQVLATNEKALPPVGGGQPHNNMQPYLATYFSIALAGVMPVRP